MEAYKQLDCRDIGTFCGLTVNGKDEAEVVKTCLEHDCSSHHKCRDLQITEEVRSHIKTIPGRPAGVWYNWTFHS
jgi:predicted small metal-binding protein